MQASKANMSSSLLDPAVIGTDTASVSSLVALAQTLSREAEKLDRYLKENGKQQPTFDVEGPMDFPALDEEMQKSRKEIIRASKDLYDLCVGPAETVRWMAWNVSSPPPPQTKSSGT